ncbi:MAG TPA: hypothetical protein VHQ46_06720 [Desulfobacteria bacterium]|nr:hypothetical protein [Desulfobacteria bacterium]
MLALLLVLILATGCGNILDRVTKKEQPVKATSGGQVTNATTQKQTSSTSKELTLKDLQQALKEANQVKLFALDTGGSLVLDAAKRKVLIDALDTAGELKESPELVQAVASAAFPNYQLKIEGDKNLQIDVYDSVRFGAGTENERHYYMEKGEIWTSLKRWLPPKTYTEVSLGYLFKATKVTAEGDTFTENTDVTAARNPILRTIRAVTLQSTTLPQDAGEPLTLTFSVSGQKHTIKLYDGYLVFRDVTYKFPPGKQAIESLLSPG